MKENGISIWQKTEDGWTLRYQFNNGVWWEARDQAAWPDGKAPFWLNKEDYKSISEEEVFAIVL